MEDLSAKLSEILNSPDGIKQITQMAEQLGLDTSQLDGMLNNEPPPKKEPPPKDAFDGLNVETIIKVQKLINSMNEKNADTALLDALKPYVSAERSQRIEDAKRIMSLMQLIPLINGGGEGV